MELEHAPNDSTRKEMAPLLKLALELGPLGVFFLFNSRGEQIAESFPILQKVGEPIFLATAAFMVAITISLTVLLPLHNGGDIVVI